MLNTLKSWELPERDVERLVTSYWDHLHKIDQRFLPHGIVHTNKLQLIPLVEIVSKLPQIEFAIRAFVDKVLSPIADAECPVVPD